MNNKKICFIMCANNDMYVDESRLYIDNLNVPDGFSTEVIVIRDAFSMTSGYNTAMRQTDAKYKVYMHQDILIVNKNFINDILMVFQKYSQVGILGVIGNKKLAPDGCPWTYGPSEQLGEAYSDLIELRVHYKFSKPDEDYQKAVVLDGILMVTQYDLPWREDLFKGWHFYDCSQSMEFWRAGYEVAVPKMYSSWCLHDNAIPNLSDYDKWQAVFAKEYSKDYLSLQF